MNKNGYKFIGAALIGGCIYGAFMTYGMIVNVVRFSEYMPLLTNVLTTQPPIFVTLFMLATFLQGCFVVGSLFAMRFVYKVGIKLIRK